MIVQLPDGKTAEFPDTMNQGEIEAVLQKQYQPQAQPSPMLDALKNLGKGAINQLPAAGMIGGGILGSAAGPIGAPVGAGLGAGIGAAAKGYLNEALGITPPKPPIENWQDIGKEGMVGSMAEMGGPILAKGIQKVTSPFAATVAERMATQPSIKAAQDLVEQQGAQISPEVIAGTKTSRFFDWMAEKMWPANAIMARGRESLQPIADSLKNEFVASRGVYDTSKQGVNQLWENWVQQAGGPAAPYEMPKTLQTISEAMKKPFAMEMKTTTDAAGNVIKESVPVGAFWKKYASTFKQGMEENGQVSVQEIRDLLNTLNPTAAKGAERTARMKIADAIMEDLGASGNQEMVASLQAAREGARLQRIAGPLQNIFNRSTIEPTKAGEEVIFSPSKFTNLWNQQRGRFLENKNYSAEDIRVIDAFADKMKALVPDLGMASQFKPSFGLEGITQFSPQNPLALGYGAYNYPAIAVPVGLDAMLARSLMSPNGIMRRFLTTGFNPPILSSKVGLMQGLEANK